jgi:hypothetical protein
MFLFIIRCILHISLTIYSISVVKTERLQRKSEELLPPPYLIFDNNRKILLFYFLQSLSNKFTQFFATLSISICNTHL